MSGTASADGSVAGDVVALPEVGARDSVRWRDVLSAYVGAHQAADHRAAAGHHRAGDVPGRRRDPAADAGARHPGRRLPGGRQCQRLQLRPRPRHRRADAAHPSSPAAAAPGRPRSPRRSSAVVLGIWPRPCGSGTWSTGCRPLLALAANVFYVFVYTMWLEAAHVAEHRLGRHRRLLPAPDRLDGRHRVDRPGRRSSCSPSCSSGPRRTPGRWPCATARTTPRPACRCCRWSGAAGGRPADPDLLGGHRRRVSLALWPIAPTGWLYPLVAAVAGAALIWESIGLLRRAERRAAGRRAEADAAVPLVELLPGAAVRGRGRRPAAVLIRLS